jgi:aspartyl-tRNA synthetase
MGEVVARATDAVNSNIKTGEIEVKISQLIVESAAEQIPFQINDSNEYPEELRLKYRFLDLRREKTHKNIILRSQVISSIRSEMTAQGFLEIQTPILTASSPEGARDYLVPARLHPGKFYALPQAPQQFKQLLMVAGFNRYFQIAPCFRDEDLRADRTPEFYQLDMEMSFVEQEDVFSAIEPVLKTIFKKYGVKKTSDENFIHISYEEAMLKYGIDKPDLRNPILISDATNIFRGSDFSIFAKQIEQGATIRAIPAPKCAAQPRSFFDKMIEFAQGNGAKGLAYIIFDEMGEGKGPIAKFLSAEKKLKPKQELPSFLSQFLPKSLAIFLAQKILHDGNLADLSNQKIIEIARLVNAFEIAPSGTEGFAKAEVTLGGVDVEQISSKNFMAKKVPNLFFIGEVLDVTGWLGGFNFQWAWASGSAAGWEV